MSLFDLATRLARAEADATLRRAAAKTLHMQGVACGCSAYAFPHRAGGGQCPAPDADPDHGCTLDEESALFDRAEARAINSGAW
jgi:hypothetical protein